MQKFWIILLMAGLFVIVSLSCSDKTNEPSHNFDVYPVAGSFQWHDLSVVWDSSAAKKPYSALFICASWCGWCRLLEENTLTDSTVMGLLDTYFNTCIIDGDSDSLVNYCDTMLTCVDFRKDVLDVHAFPTTIFYDRAGKEIGKFAGYYEPKSFANLLWGVCIGWW